jgi:modulator of FtsH protease HflK
MNFMKSEQRGWRGFSTLFNEAGGPWGRKGGGGSSGGSGGGSGNGDGGGDGPRNPWDLPPGGGRKPRGSGPSALDEVTKRWKQMGGGDFQGGNGRLVRNVLIGLLVLWLVLTCVWRIEPQQEGVVTRFGAYQGRLEPGIGLTLPWPIEAVEKVDVRAINTTNIPDGDGINYVLTGDRNVVDITYSVRWEKSNPENYKFSLANPDETVREVAETAMRETVSQVKLGDALGPGRGQIVDQVARRMQTILDSYKAGVTVRGVAIKKAQPPADVVEEFNLVTVKQQEKQKNINNANLYARQIIEKAEGDAQAFDKVYEQYKLAPGVTRRRMYYETMEDVLTRTDKTIVEPGSIAPYLPIGRNAQPVTVEGPRK